jgi:hypothetical protein
MNVAIRQPQLKSPPHLLCDWLELKALASRQGSFRLGTLRRLWDISRESEGSDPEGRFEREDDTDIDGVSGYDDEAFIDSISDEFGDRAQALGSSYPFRLNSGNALQVVGPPNEGGYTYLFCLLLTHANGADLLSGSWYPRVDNSVRDLFQGCSTVAAAAEVQGCAISFGWPRPNQNPPFLQRLREVYSLFGEGVVVPQPRPGVSPCPKDEEIDVIAWRPRPDKSPGATYMLGQVASGNNWESKPIKGAPIDNFHRNWFQPPPPSQALASIFIPHAVPPIGLEGTRRERLDAITARYGVIIDRMRLPRLAQDGSALARETSLELVIERMDSLSAIGHWVNEQLHGLHEMTT